MGRRCFASRVVNIFNSLTSSTEFSSVLSRHVLIFDNGNVESGMEWDWRCRGKVGMIPW